MSLHPDSQSVAGYPWADKGSWDGELESTSFHRMLSGWCSLRKTIHCGENCCPTSMFQERASCLEKLEDVTGSLQKDIVTEQHVLERGGQPHTQPYLFLNTPVAQLTAVWNAAPQPALWMVCCVLQDGPGFFAAPTGGFLSGPWWATLGGCWSAFAHLLILL